ncbi:MAG: hypothetical protein GF383_16120 [Candidatus Lokiarchaeota archaeon]|nr:hypothetical protein [Candidatus Lokiarchaeota archaeon]MBD3343258.1 hypothetical protein [Candidatus Lokiarchaeota archaeon]
MLEEPLIDLGIAVYSVMIVFLFIFMYRRGGILFSWVLITVANAFANLLFYFRHYDPIFRIIGNIFYFLAALILSYSVIGMYYKTFLKPKRNSNDFNARSKIPIILIVFTFSLINIIQISLCVFLVVIGGLLFKVYLEKRLITHIFMLLAVINGFLTLFISILHNSEVEGAWELAYFVKIIYVTSFLATGLSAPMENRIKVSEKRYFEAFNRAEFYKDLFAHDISNILQNIQSSIDLIPFYLKDSKKLEKIEKFLSIANEQVKRGALLNLNVRRLSELENSGTSLNKINVIGILREAVDYIKSSSAEKSLRITLNNEIEEFIIKANGLLRDLFENLMNNSIRHNKNQIVEIIINVSKVNREGLHYVRIEFIDNGVGIREELKSSIFQRLYCNNRGQEGTGLGLCLVQEIVKNYNGKIWVEDRIPGDYKQGSNFVLLLPEAGN